jgi:DNA mismatch repair protein MutS
MTSKKTPMIDQYLSIKEQYKDAILFYQAGDFFEMFFEDAKIASKELNIALTSRNKKNADAIPMCGFPLRAVSGYLSKMIAKGYKVAICEQIENPEDSSGIIKREVVRIVTPGMVLEDDILDAGTNNYIVSILIKNNFSGLACLDISTGTFKITESDELSAIKEEILRISPSEILVPNFLKNNSNFKEILTLFKEKTITFLENDVFDIRKGKESLTLHFNTLSLSGFGAENYSLGIGAAGALLYYVKKTQKQDIEHLTKLETYSLKNFMMLDALSFKNLELIKNIRSGDKKGTLLSVIDKTLTPMGGRKIRKWLAYPLLNKNKIDKRLDAVEEAKKKISIRRSIRENLKSVFDIERLASKISMGQANARDLLFLKRSVLKIPNILKELENFHSELFKGFDDIEKLYKIENFIDKAISDDAPYILNEGGIIKKGYNKELDELIEIGSDSKKWLAKLEARERKQTGINSLKVSFNKIFGYYIEVSKLNTEKVPVNYVRKQTLVNAERYITEELKNFETDILTSKDKRIKLEYDLFIKVKSIIIQQIVIIYNLADFISRIDLILSFAEIADIQNYTKPEIKNDSKISIEDGRHPVVEKTITGERFVPNSIFLDNISNQVLIITGPNMAGKSTVLRQTALIAIMAHIGCFVPAKNASICIIDRIFTRVGALDNLSSGQSTFMVEMEETANILNNATPKSLVIMDEIGRGTSTFDGFSIAKAVAEYLHDSKGRGVKTLFATHYHELVELAQTKKRVKNFNIAVREVNDEIIFLRKLTPGGTNRSYGIQVARLAGVPDKIIKRAKKILTDIEKKDSKALYNNALEFGSQLGIDIDIDLNNKKAADNKIFNKIKDIKTESITPLCALNFLDELKKEIKGLNL